MAGMDVFSGAAFSADCWTDSVTYDAATGVVTVNGPVNTTGFAAQLDGSAANVGDVIDVLIDPGTSNLSTSASAVSDFADGIVLFDGNNYIVFSSVALVAGQVIAPSQGFGNYTGFSAEPACFAAGTRLATARGLVAVEALRPGDRMETVLRRDLSPVRWIGHRRIDFATWPDPRNAWPVRVAAGAFGPGRPARDVRLSPHHAVFFEGMLAPVLALADGRRIVQEPCEAITYWHVELARHDVLLAEGLPAESYFDCGNRAAFVGSVATAPHAPETRRCARLVVDGPDLARLRRRLQSRHRDAAPPAAMAAAAFGQAVFSQSWHGGERAPKALASL